MRVKFTDHAILQHRDGVVEFEAQAGEIRDLKEDVAQRWMKRNKAVLFSEEDEIQEMVEEEAKAEAAADEPIIQGDKKAKRK